MATRNGHERGFAAMDPEKHRRISAEGGRHSHSGNMNHGGRRGGSGTAAEDRGRTKEAGRKGGRARAM